MVSDDDGAGTGRLVGHDLVRGLEALAVVGSTELVRERVGADGAEVGGGASREDVLSKVDRSERARSRLASFGREGARCETDLSSAGRVLGSTTGDVQDLVVLLQVGVAVAGPEESANAIAWSARVGEEEGPHISFCLPSARTASFFLRPYFSRSSGASETDMSRSGLPMARTARGADILDVIACGQGRRRSGGVLRGLVVHTALCLLRTAVWCGEEKVEWAHSPLPGRRLENRGDCALGILFYVHCGALS